MKKLGFLALTLALAIALFLFYPRQKQVSGPNTADNGSAQRITSEKFWACYDEHKNQRAEGLGFWITDPHAEEYGDPDNAELYGSTQTFHQNNDELLYVSQSGSGTTPKIVLLGYAASKPYKTSCGQAIDFKRIDPRSPDRKTEEVVAILSREHNTPVEYLKGGW